MNELPGSPDTQAEAVDGQTFSGVRCELCGVVRMNSIYSHHGVVRCQDHYICAQVVALVAGARPTYEDLIEAGWKPAFSTPSAEPDGPAQGGAEVECDDRLIRCPECLSVFEAEDSTIHSSSAESLAAIIWNTSRADESTISATGANIVAAAAVAAKVLRDAAKAIRLGLDTSNHIGQGVECACKQLDDLAARAGAPATVEEESWESE